MVSPNTGLYYYGARYYNPQVSVWLSVDRLAAKYPNSSPYVFTGNNPIMLIDPNGDSLDVAQNAASINDVISIVSKDNLQYLSIVDGNASLNFGDLSDEEMQEKLSGDKGLTLLNSLISDDKKYYYECGDQSYEYSNILGIVSSEYSSDGKNNYDFIDNMSVTPRNLKGKGPAGASPLYYDGYVRISPGSFERETVNGFVSIPRQSVVFHELTENYLRTHHGMPYSTSSGTIGAHGIAKLLEGSWYTPNTKGAVRFNHE